MTVRVRAWLFVLGLGCAGTQLEGRAGALHDLLKKARENGAERCAPRELALAEAHTEFAELELAEGDYYRAKEELAIAEPNARAAVEKSPREKCSPKEVAVHEPERTKRLDSDEDGLFDDEDKCPQKPEDRDSFQDEDGCPDPDNDGDGIVDLDDKCPLHAEDVDHFEDEDGCPDDDNDKDQLADRVDRCPNQAEDMDGFEDTDGCPDGDNDRDSVIDHPEARDKCPNEYAETPDGCPQKYQLIVVTEDKIVLRQTIFFEFRKAVIRPVSFPLLDEVAQALSDRPELRVEIQGHTDSKGSDSFNLTLSQKRADAVRLYLVGRGIAAGRMVSRGYGETVPISDNRTQAGRDQNRRVEFMIMAP